MDDKLLRKDFQRAQSLAYWSYVGILVPIIGWILGGLSRSITRDLYDAQRHRKQKPSPRLKHIYNVAAGGLVVSTVVFVMAAGFAIWGLALSSDLNYVQDEPASTAQEESLPQESTSSYNQTMLNTCIDDTNKWYDDNLKNVETIFQAETLLASKQQYIAECQIKYPVN